MRKPLEVPIRVGRTVGLRLPLLVVFVPCVDGLALLVVVAAARFNPLAIVYGVTAFLVLNADPSRTARINPRVGDDAGWLLGRLAVPLLGLVLLADVVGVNAEGPLLLGPIAATLVLSGRGIAYALGRSWKARGLFSEKALIVGAGSVGVELAHTIEEHPEYGLRPIGFLHRLGDQGLPLPLLGESRDLERVVSGFDVRRVIVAYGDESDHELVTILRKCERLPIQIHIVPRFFEMGVPPAMSVDDVWGIPLIHLRRPALRPYARVVKRVFDLVIASLALVLASPVMLVAAVAVRLSSPGPILFRQQRVGLDDRVFDILKFRTMRVNGDSDTAWFVSSDHRVTSVGRVLRRTSVDELPQLFNVVRGDMSLVGPRPERPHYVGRFSATVSRYEDRHRVPGGITGWAQIHGRSRGLDSIPERARFDNAYIEDWSLWRDIVIMFRTVGLLFRGDGA